MYAGPGPGPLLAAAASWDEVAAELESAGAGYASQIADLTGLSWFGPSSLAMSGAAAPYVAWLQAAAEQAGVTATQAYAAAAAYETAFAMTVPPPAIAANRAQLMALIATNFFGQNGPAIAATEAQYMQMWVQDAAAMYTYAADASAASALQTFDEPPKTTNQSGQDAQGQSVAQTTAGRTQSLMQSLAVQQTNLVDPPLPNGSTANIAPGGATLQPGTTVTIAPGYSVTNTPGATLTAGPNGITWTNLDAGVPGVGLSGSSQAGGSFVFVDHYVITGGSFTVNSPYFGGTGGFSVSSGSVTAGSTGVEATIDASTGLVTSINAGTVITGPVTATPYVFPASVAPVAPVVSSSSSALAAAPAAAPVISAPGLAGTAAIQPQLDVDALMDALSAAE